MWLFLADTFFLSVHVHFPSLFVLSMSEILFTTGEHLQESSQEASECEVPTKEAGAPHQRGATRRKGVALTSQQVTKKKIMMQTQLVDQQLFCVTHQGPVLIMATLHVSRNMYILIIMIMYESQAML